MNASANSTSVEIDGSSKGHFGTNMPEVHVDMINNNGGGHTRFAPVEAKKDNSLNTPPVLVTYSTKFFKEFIKDDELDKSILDNAPVPDAIRAETLDEEWQDMIDDGNHVSVKATESALKRVQSLSYY
ncbi:hypothetical protein SNE40_002910 [Patella caerulea]|uniref:Uncharacterized protein n=1 Tax=Patella caerulea TaxID=87958 RepID=A0AAN8K9I0_PATCE